MFISHARLLPDGLIAATVGAGVPALIGVGVGVFVWEDMVSFGCVIGVMVLALIRMIRSYVYWVNEWKTKD